MHRYSVIEPSEKPLLGRAEASGRSQERLQAELNTPWAEMSEPQCSTPMTDNALLAQRTMVNGKVYIN